MTVRFDNCSHGMTHELVRHRLCSFAQESTRYVDESDFQVIVPPNRDETVKVNVILPESVIYKICEDASLHCIVKGMGLNDCIDYNKESLAKCIREEVNFSLENWFDLNEQIYRALRKAGWKPEDARQVLPTAIKSQIVVKANMREWRNIFRMRCDKFAHWEIRKVMLDLLGWCKVNVPVLFDDFHFFRKGDSDYARQIFQADRIADDLYHYIQAFPELTVLSKAIMKILPDEMRSRFREVF